MQNNYIFQLLEHEYTYHANLYNGKIIHSDLVSIIMPSYNNARYIFRAINSALSQQGVNIELIIVDDGSTDNSVEIAKDVAKKLSNIRVIPLLRNFGCYYARNIGISYAKGNYIIVHDSDDIAHPEMILRQLSFLKQRSDKVACQSKIQKWDMSISTQLSKPVYGENTLLWKKEIIQSIGWYDSVRYGGDTEFRYRIKKVFGDSSIGLVNDVLYARRTRESSLTTSTKTSAFDISDDGNIKLKLNESRKYYVESFRTWHKSLIEKKEHMAWPQFERPFALYTDEQIASPSLQQKKIGMMASFPPRKDVLEKTLSTILPQLDILILYLNNYDKIPSFAINPQIKVILGKDAVGDLQDNGKFYSVHEINNAYIFTLDDDILYPEDYTTTMIHYIETFHRLCVVGVHGIIFNKLDFNNIKDRQVYTFDKQAHGHFVDMVGTGTAAWHSSLLNIHLTDFKSTGLCDIYFSTITNRQYVPIFSVPRYTGWLKKAKQTTSESIYMHTVNNPSEYFDKYKKYLFPVLKNRTRQQIEDKLISIFSKDILESANIELNENCPAYNNQSIEIRRRVTLLNTQNRHYPYVVHNNFHYQVILYGRDCKDKIDSAIEAISMQAIGDYSYAVTFIDLGSSDGTFEKVANMCILPDMNLICFNTNTDLIHALRVSMKPSVNKNLIFVILSCEHKISYTLLHDINYVFRNNPNYTLILDHKRQTNGYFLAFRYASHKNIFSSLDEDAFSRELKKYTPENFVFFMEDMRKNLSQSHG